MGIRQRSGASGYLLKRSARPEFFAEHLALNGGRKLVHWSRGYFADPESGEVLGVDEVLHRVRQSRPGRGLWYRPGGVEPLDPRKHYAPPGRTAPLGVPGSLDTPERSGQTAFPTMEGGVDARSSR